MVPAQAQPLLSPSLGAQEKRIDLVKQRIHPSVMQPSPALCSIRHGQQHSGNKLD
jgi:hypothetical protein